jgi:hypothetical protein
VCDGPGSGPDQCCDPKPPTFKRARRRYPLSPGPTRSASRRAGAPPAAAAVSLPSSEKNANYCPPSLPRPAASLVVSTRAGRSHAVGIALSLPKRLVSAGAPARLALRSFRWKWLLWRQARCVHPQVATTHPPPPPPLSLTSLSYHRPIDCVYSSAFKFPSFPGRFLLPNCNQASACGQWGPPLLKVFFQRPWKIGILT